MLNRVKAWFVPPTFADEEQNRKAILLNAIVLMSYGVAAGGAAALLIIHPDATAAFALIGIWIVLAAIPVGILRRGHVQLAVTSFSVLLWLVIFALNIVSGGVHSPSLLGYVTVVLVAGLLMGGQRTALFAGLCILSGLATLQLELSALLPSALLFRTPAEALLGTGVLLVLASAIIRFAYTSMENARASSRRQEQVLSETNRELQIVRSALEERVADLEHAQAALQKSRDQLETRVQERTAALRASEEELRALFAALPDVIMVLDSEGRYVRVAPSDASLRYRPPDQVNGKYVRDFFPPELASTLVGNIRRALESKKPVSVEYPGRDAFGNAVWFNASVSPLTVDTVLVVARDITERKQIEQEILRRSEELSVLNEIGQILSRLANPSEILDNLHETIGRVIDNRNLYIALYDEDKDYVSFPVYTIDGVRRANETGRPFRNGITEYVIRTRSHVLIGDRGTTFFAEKGIEPVGKPMCSFLAVPMILGNKVLGVIAVQDYEKEHVYDEGHVELLSIVAAQAAIALQNARLYAAAQHELAERKRAEAALTTERNWLRTLIDVVPDYIFVKDRRGCYLLNNKAHLWSLGASRIEDVAGKSAYDFHPHELAERYTADETRLMETGEPILDREEPSLNKATGKLRWHLSSKVPVRDSQGTITGLLSLTRDITERKQADELLRLQTKYLRVALEAGRAANTLFGLDQVLPRVTDLIREHLGFYHVGLMLTDERRQFATLMASSSENGAHDLQGKVRLPLNQNSITSHVVQTGQAYIAQDVSGDPYYCAHPDLPDTHAEAIFPLVVGGTTVGALDVQSKQVNTFEPDTISILTTIADQVAMAVQNARLHADVAARAKELEEAYQTLRDGQEKLLISEKMASLGRLTAGIAHEMNTPLAAARAALVELEKLADEYAASIDDASVTPVDHHEIAKDMRRSSQIAQRALERAAGYVRSIKFQTRDLDASERHRFDAAAAIQDALLLLSYGLRKTGCTIHFECGDDPPPLVGSPAKLGQVVTNLVSNAIDASTVKGGGPITIRLARADQEVTLQVIDQGCGIAPENLPRIFEPMFTTKPLGQGTGLGLSIVHDIVTGEFGGTIQVSSQVDRGTTFSIRFPV